MGHALAQQKQNSIIHYVFLLLYTCVQPGISLQHIEKNFYLSGWTRGAAHLRRCIQKGSPERGAGTRSVTEGLVCFPAEIIFILKEKTCQCGENVV